MKKKKARTVPNHITAFLKEFQYLFGVQTYDRAVILESKDSKNFAASIFVEEDYQRITIKIFPCFFENELADQRRYLLHEFCHYFTTDLADTARNLLNGDLVTKEQIRVANEKGVSRATNIIESILLGKERHAQSVYSGYLKTKKR